MTQKNSRLKTIDSLVSDTLSIIEMMEEIPDFHYPSLEGFRKNCREIPEHIASGRLKIAVVGVIKSGKSTFINALLGKELVKRGAGVVTAVTTRIRKGKKNKATICLKSWDEINTILRKNLEMFSDDPGERDFIAALDLRRKKDREFLGRALKKLKSEFPVLDQGIRPEALSIQHALDGYEFCKDVVEADETELVFESRQFEKHKKFTADASHAFFVKDVCLEMFGSTLNSQMEIADCQGADSTDPDQLAQVIRYLESANLIIYCISSRTGLRKSDLEFLKLIKRMGLLAQILFVNNCDLSEHDSLTNLKSIEAHTRSELEYLMENPRIYSFSALFDLFESLKKLNSRNAKRLALWQDDEAMANFCRRNGEAFKTMFQNKLEKEHFDLLVANHLERLEMMLGNMADQIEMFLKLSSPDEATRADADRQLKRIRENAQRMKTIVDNSMDGAVSGLVKEVKANITKAFSQGEDAVKNRVKAHIKTAPMDVAPYRPHVKETGFKKILYLMFQDFKRELDLFLLKDIIPDIKTLVDEQERRITIYFQSLMDSYRIDPVHWAREEGEEGRGDLSKDLNLPRSTADVSVDTAAVRRILGLELPPPLFSPRFTRRMKANAFTGLSLHSIGLLIKSMFQKRVKFSFTPGFNLAAGTIKDESLSTFVQHMNAYEKELVADYLMPLIDAVTREFKEKMDDRFSVYETMNQDLDRLYALKQEEKEERLKALEEMGSRIRDCRDRLDRL